MKKIIAAFTLSLALAVSPALAHHPAADMVDPDIYAVIDEMVSDTPHALLEFDDTMGAETTTITTDSVSVAEDLIEDYLLADLSLLDDDVTVTITFGPDVEPVTTLKSKSTKKNSSWNNGKDWGRQVIITVDTLLCDPAIPAGEYGTCDRD